MYSAGAQMGVKKVNRVRAKQTIKNLLLGLIGVSSWQFLNGILAALPQNSFSPRQPGDLVLRPVAFRPRLTTSMAFSGCQEYKHLPYDLSIAILNNDSILF
jgi:hypothetical protein